jgi:hypothetical protein
MPQSTSPVPERYSPRRRKRRKKKRPAPARRRADPGIAIRKPARCCHVVVTQRRVISKITAMRGR